MWNQYRSAPREVNFSFVYFLTQKVYFSTFFMDKTYSIHAAH